MRTKVPDGPPQNVFLVGYRCTGKTTMAQLLAAALGWPWTDADQLLESRHGRTIAQLFQEGSESGFRALESELLEELCRSSARVIATGGGIILNPDNRARLKASGHVVWLQADPATIWRRLQADPATAARRPKLTTGGLAEIEELLRRREPLYRACADCTVDTAGRSPEQVLKLILGGLPPRQ
jgi:shikimate kinase